VSIDTLIRWSPASERLRERGETRRVRRQGEVVDRQLRQRPHDLHDVFVEKRLAPR